MLQLMFCCFSVATRVFPSMCALVDKKPKDVITPLMLKSKTIMDARSMQRSECWEQHSFCCYLNGQMQVQVGEKGTNQEGCPGVARWRFCLCVYSIIPGVQPVHEQGINNQTDVNVSISYARWWRMRMHRGRFAHLQHLPFGGVEQKERGAIPGEASFSTVIAHQVDNCHSLILLRDPHNIHSFIVVCEWEFRRYSIVLILLNFIFYFIFI